MNLPIAHFTIFAKLLTAGVVATGFSVAAQSSNDQPVAVPIVEFKSIRLSDVVANLARSADLNYILDPKAGLDRLGADGRIQPEPSITLRLENVTAGEALAKVLKEHGLRLSENPATGVVRIMGTNRSANIARPVDPAWIKAGTNSPVPLIVFQDMSLVAGLRQLAKTDGLAAEIEEAIEGPRKTPGRISTSPTVTLRWEKITPRQAIAALCENYDLAMATNQSSGAIQITRRVTAEPEAATK